MTESEIRADERQRIIAQLHALAAKVASKERSYLGPTQKASAAITYAASVIGLEET